MNYDEIFKEYCQKQNPNETISGGCAVFVLGFVDFLKQKAVEHSMEPTCPTCGGKLVDGKCFNLNCVAFV